MIIDKKLTNVVYIKNALLECNTKFLLQLL